MSNKAFTVYSAYKINSIEITKVPLEEYLLVNGIIKDKNDNKLVYYFGVETRNEGKYKPIFFLSLDNYGAFKFYTLADYILSKSKKKIATELSLWEKLVMEDISDNLIYIGLKKSSGGDMALTIKKTDFMYIYTSIRNFYQNYYQIAVAYLK